MHHFHWWGMSESYIYILFISENISFGLAPAGTIMKLYRFIPIFWFHTYDSLVFCYFYEIFVIIKPTQVTKFISNFSGILCKIFKL